MRLHTTILVILLSCASLWAAKRSFWETVTIKAACVTDTQYAQFWSDGKTSNDTNAFIEGVCAHPKWYPKGTKITIPKLGKSYTVDDNLPGKYPLKAGGFLLFIRFTTEANANEFKSGKYRVIIQRP